MATFLRLYLTVTGIGAAIALLFPTLVVIAMFLIVPGLILAVMPTAFLWGGLFALIWFSLHGSVANGFAAPIALVATAAILWLAPQPSRAISAYRLAAAIRPDVTPPAPIALRGHLRIDMVASATEPYDPARLGVRPVRCNALCAAALFTDGVDTVTLNPLGYGRLTEEQATGQAPLTAGARTFRLVPKNRCTETLRPTDAAGLGLAFEEVQALEAEWNLRLSTRDCIVALPTRSTHDMAIADASYEVAGGDAGYGWDIGPRGVHVIRLEVRRGDAVLLRRLVAKTSALARPLYVGAGGSLENFRFGWEREALSNAPRYASPDSGKTLSRFTDLAAHVDPARTAGLVRQRLGAMLADPSVGIADPGWTAAEPYLRSLRHGPVSAEDRALVANLVRDRRMTKFDGLWDAIRGLGDDGTLLREPMVDRLADPGPGEQAAAVRTLGKAIAALPPGAFAAPSAAQLALLSDPAARRRAPGLIERQADRGADAVPLLLQITDYHARAWAAAGLGNRGASVDRDADAAAVDAARVAFCRLGPDAAAALPSLMGLYRQRLLERGFSDERGWIFTLARLGQPIDTFSKPDSLSGTTDAFRERIRQRLRRFRPDRDC